jgi:hypothetical protein
MYYSEKNALTSSFYDDMREEPRRSFLEDHGIRYDFFGPSENGLGVFEPVSSPYLSLRIQGGGISIYEVVNP